MSDGRSILSRDLDAATAEIRRATELWELEELTHRSSDQRGPGREAVIDAVTTAFLAVIAVLERHGHKALVNLLLRDWEAKYSAAPAATYFPESGDKPLRLASADTLWRYIAAVRVGLPAVATYAPPSLDHVEKILRGLPVAVQRADFKITSERDLDKMAEALLLPLFPDLNPSPALALPFSYRMPDSGIPSLNLLIEYKIIKERSSTSPILDEIQADIRNYRHDPWRHLIILTAMADNYITETAYREQVTKEPSSFQSILPILIRV